MERDFAHYLRHHRAQHSNDEAIAWHRNIVGYFRAFLKGQGQPDTIAEGLTPANARDWPASCQGRGLSQRSLASHTQSPKAFGRCLTEEESFDRDPLRKLKPPKYDDKARPTYAPEDAETPLKAGAQGTAATSSRAT
jgi:site-specific recombinase XerC